MRFSRSGSPLALARDLPDPRSLALQLNRLWARDAKLRAQEKFSGGPGTRYLIARTGGTRARVEATATPHGAELSVTGPGVRLLEEGGTVTAKNGRYLTFRLHTPQDQGEATGPWVRVRSVTVQARHPIRDSGDEATADLGVLFQEVMSERAY